MVAPLYFQIELFAKVFTMIGKDMSGSLCLSELMCNLRDAFLLNLDNDSKTLEKLLHLIELQSSDWQLSPDAVTYYSTSPLKKSTKELHTIVTVS